VAGAVTAPAPAARVVETGLAAPGAAAEAAARETRLAFHAVEAARGKKRVAATGEGAGFGPLAFSAALRGSHGRLLLFEGPPHDLVHKGESHPGVGTAAAMDGAPAGVGGQDLSRTGAMLGCEEVPGRNYLALGMGAEPPLNELVESHKVEMKLESRIQNLPVGAVPDLVTAGDVDVAEESRGGIEPGNSVRPGLSKRLV
jgi:hypothetical protein